MDDRSLRALEFYHLLEILREYSVSPLGRKRCEALRPSKNLPEIESRLAEVLELKEILETYGELPIRGLKDIEGVLKRCEVEGSVLTVQELLDIFHQIELGRGLRRFFSKLEPGKAPRLQEKVAGLSSLRDLEKEILHAMNTKGEILDRASPTLSDVRHRLRTTREKAKGVLEHLLHKEELQPIFQEQFITLRNGRYVFLIKSDYKNRIEGIVHDQSQSRMTIFFEPLQAIAYNNEINILVGEEKEEEYRILADLSMRAREEIQKIERDLEILGEFDLLYAMARLSILLKGIQPALKTDGRIELREARHPLLALQKEDEVVPIHLRMGDGIRILMISGANAGGKTVALKTLGLLTLMLQSGLPIPVAEGSEGTVFEEVFAVVGDEQNIEENLSTFSSHLLHLNQILEKAGPCSLLLLDELGVGTDASEGSSLAMGVLDRLREIGSSVVVTTHFDRLKAYGYLHPDVENVAVEFDEETLEPRYTLSYGSSGLSNAFLVAEKLGVSARVLEMARHYRDGGGQEVSRTLEELERLKAEAKKEQIELLKTEEEVRLQRQRLKGLLESIKKRRQEIHAQAEEKARKMVLEMERDLKEWVRKKKTEKPVPKMHRREIQEVKERFFPSLKKKGHPATSTGLKVGEHVRIGSLRSNGILIKVEEASDRAEVMTERGRVKASLSDIVVADEKETAEKTERPKAEDLLKGSVKEPVSQLNVIGLTVEDALPKVDKFIDQALLHGLEKVQIIHGIGSGRLRNAIGKYLDGHRGVKSFAPGDRERGGQGLTVVELL